MQFYVEGYSSSHDIPEQDMKIFPHIKLVTDDFDDYDNQTLFRMFFKRKRGDNYHFLGKIKILHATRYIVRKVIPFSFKMLDNEYCSLGQSIEYYKRIRELNTNSLKYGREILIALNDIAINSDIKNKFPDQNGITNSLMRDSEAFHAFKQGHNIFYGISSHIQEKLEFIYTYDKERDKKVYFEFNDQSGMPNRINVVVGKNGTGKTKMLSSLASVLSGYNNMENKYCVDKRPEFSRYIAVSYSAFDNFEKPFGKKFSKSAIVYEKNHILNGLYRQMDKCKMKADNDKDFRALWEYFNYVINSIKTFEKEQGFQDYFGALLCGYEMEEIPESYNEIGSYVYCGLQRENRLISEKEMFEEFEKNLSEIIRMSRIEEWESVMKNIFDDFADLKFIFKNEKIKAEEIIEENFYELSSGQKIILYIFTQVIMSLTEDSLLLIDEPEIHLHPNAISNFMRMLNKLLAQFNSFAIISTHSPIILQEIPSKYVRIFDNNILYDDRLWEECFGDNISRIITNVFNVRPDESNYKTFFLEKKNAGVSKGEIENLFEDKLSMNAEMYLNLLYRDEE